MIFHLGMSWLPPWLTEVSIDFINATRKQIDLCTTLADLEMTWLS